MGEEEQRSEAALEDRAEAQKSQAALEAPAQKQVVLVRLKETLSQLFR